MPSPDEYRVLVSAGTDYDTANHVPVRVNSATPLKLSGPGGDVWLNVRIKNYRGPDEHPVLGETPDPESSPYFDKEPHKANDDTYGIGLWFVPRAATGASAAGEDKKEDKKDDTASGSAAGISGTDLQWGNDFDEPLRDRLPPGFGAALRIVKWWIDPGLEGDPYADKPYLYGPALSSFNRVYAALGAESESSERSEEGEGGDDDKKNDDNERSEDKKNKSERSEEKKKDYTQPPVHDDCGLWFDEGGDEGGRQWRESIGAPGEDVDATTGDENGNGKARMKWALGADAKSKWVWKYGQGYGLDFYNGYLDFADLTLRLPGFHLPLLRYYASDKAEKTALRYVLRHRGTGEVYLAVVFRLVRSEKADGNDEEDEKDEDDEVDDKEEDDEVDDDKIIEEARRKLSSQGINTDDVD